MTRDHERSLMREKMQRFAGGFLERCAGDLRAARELLVRLRAGELDAFAQLERLAHRLRGTGASLGFESLDASAGAIERSCALQRGAVSLDHAVIEGLAEHLERLEAEVARLSNAAG